MLHSIGHIFPLKLMKIAKSFFFDNISDREHKCLNQVTRSNLRKILETTFSLKTWWEFVSMFVLNKYGKRLYVVQNLVTRSNLRKMLFILKRPHFVRMFVFITSWMSTKMGHEQSKSRSLGQKQKIEFTQIHFRDYNFTPKFMNANQMLG